MAPRRLSAFTVRPLAGLMVMVGAGLVFGLLAALVETAWQPLRTFDRSVAAQLNEWVSGTPVLVTALQVVTWLGDGAVVALLLGAATVWLLVRRRLQLAGFVAVTGIGAAGLIPTLKDAVGRTRPLLADPVAAEGGESFPSGHAINSMVCYGVLLLVFLPAVRPGARPYLAAGSGLVMLAVGFTRVALGVHFVSDVLAGWSIGLAWLGLTTVAFQHGLPRPARVVAELVIAWVLVFGLVYGAGLLVTTVLPGTVDRAVVDWFVAHRGETHTAVAVAVTWLGSAWAVSVAGLVAAVTAVAATRRWCPVLFLFLVMAGELTLYLASSRLVERRRPEVPTVAGESLENLTSASLSNATSFPSGHVAATIALYGGIAVLATGSAHRAWRWLTVALAVVIPLLVGAARIYLGLHYPTDYLGSLLVALPWLLACWWITRWGATGWPSCPPCPELGSRGARPGRAPGTP